MRLVNVKMKNQSLALSGNRILEVDEDGFVSADEEEAKSLCIVGFVVVKDDVVIPDVGHSMIREDLRVSEMPKTFKRRRK